MLARLTVRHRLLAGAAALMLGAAAAGCATSSGTAVNVVVDRATSDLALAQQSGSVAQYTAVITPLQNLSSEGSLTATGQSVLGQAYLGRAAATGSAADYASAADAFGAAGAPFEQAEALMAVFNAGLGTREYLDTAVDAYTASIEQNPTAAAYFGLASAYRARRDRDDEALAAAAVEAGRALGPDGTSPQDYLNFAASLPEGSEDEALRYVTMATDAPSAPPEAHAALGKLLYARALKSGASQDFQAALAAFDKVTGSGRPMAEALYHKSVINTRGTPNRRTLIAAIGNAKDAVRAGGSEFRFQRQVCLLTIQRGPLPTAEENDDELAIYAEELEDECQSNTAIPEGRLVAGMSQVRLAQYHYRAAGQRAMFNTMAQAGQQFQQGLSLLGQAIPADSRTIQLPEMADPAPVGDFLKAGYQVVERCTSSLAPRPLELEGNPTGAARQQQLELLSRQLQKYEAFDCEP